MAERDGHMEGFEKEEALQQMHGHPEIRERLFKWGDFNGATYTIEETGEVTGCAYFDLVDHEPA